MYRRTGVPDPFFLDNGSRDMRVDVGSLYDTIIIFAAVAGVYPRPGLYVVL